MGIYIFLLTFFIIPHKTISERLKLKETSNIWWREDSQNHVGNKTVFILMDHRKLTVDCTLVTLTRSRSCLLHNFLPKYKVVTKHRMMLWSTVQYKSSERIYSHPLFKFCWTWIQESVFTEAVRHPDPHAATADIFFSVRYVILVIWKSSLFPKHPSSQG